MIKDLAFSYRNLEDTAYNHWLSRFKCQSRDKLGEAQDQKNENLPMFPAFLSMSCGLDYNTSISPKMVILKGLLGSLLQCYLI